MKAITKKKWINSLLSPIYHQYRGWFYETTARDIENCKGFCVIGMLNKVLGRPSSQNFPKCLSSNLATKLMKMNDSEGKTFPELAKYIQKNLKTED